MSMNRFISRVLAAAIASSGLVVPLPTIGASLSCTGASFSATSDGNGNINVSCTQAGTTAPPPTSPPPTSPPPPPPPPGETISCPGFDQTHVLDVVWASKSGGVRVVTKGFSHNEIVVARFTTPSSTAPNVFSSIISAEYVDQQHDRTASLSTSPCVFPYPNPLGRLTTTTQATSSLAFTYAVGGSSAYYAILQPSTTYYLNIKNEAKGVSTCASGQSCNVYVELQKPNGL